MPTPSPDILFGAFFTVLLIAILVTGIVAIAESSTKTSKNSTKAQDDPVRAAGKEARRAIDEITREFLNQVTAALSDQEDRNAEPRPQYPKSGSTYTRPGVRSQSSPDDRP